MEQNLNCYELHPGIVVKGCSEFLVKSNGIKHKFLRLVGYGDSEYKFNIDAASGIPAYIKEILISGKVDKSKYEISDDEVSGPHLNESQGKSKWDLEAEVYNETDVKFYIVYRG